MTTTEPRILFEEHQSFRRVWWARLCMAALLVAAVAVPAAMLRGPQAPPAALALGVGALLLAVAVLMFSMELTTRVTPGVLEIHYFPVCRKRIRIEQLAHFEPLTFNPLLDAGGWGIHYSLTGYGWAFNVTGRRGVALRLTTGRRYLLGSQDPESLATALRAARR